MLRFRDRHSLKRALALCAAGWLLLAGAPAQAEPDGPCGHLYSHIQYGPFDYRHEPSEKIAIVLEAHFQPYVESLRGNADTLLGGAIDYTLRALPNYARALVAMTRLAQRDGKDPPRGAHFTVECYYIRALKFRPDDNLVRMLFADYLIDKGRGKDAAEHLDYVDKSFDKDDPFTSYNLGLLYMKLGDTAKARTLAQQARLLGNPADGLENELKKAGAWAEPAAAAAAAASSASAPADAASAVQVAAPASAPAP